MLYCKIDYKCRVCNNRKGFYVMPTDESTTSGDFVSSNTTFLVTCKECRQKYLLKVTINPTRRN